MPDLDFDWQIGSGNGEDIPPDDGGQVNLPSREDAPTSAHAARPRRWHWRAALILGLALGLIGAVASLLIVRRVDEVTTPIQKDVLSSHELVQYAVSQSDTELFTSLLSSGDYSWRTALQELYNQGLLVDRGPLGLRAQAADPQIVDAILSPDLKEAEVVAEQAYTVGVGNGVTETVRLRQTAVYRFNNQRWLLAEPGDKFWGDPRTIEGEFLTLVYPERDEPIGRRLARDLDAVLGELCAGLVEVNCPAGFHAQVLFGRSPLHLVDMFDPGGMLIPYPTLSTSGPYIALPTPTLVGVPVDEAGYQALYRGYARQVMTVVITNWAGQPQDWGMRLLHEVMLDKQLIQLGLRPWPMTAVDRDQSPPPIPLPDQDIAVFCVESLKQGGNLYRYTPQTGTWLTELSNRVFVSMSPLPDHDGVILQEQPVVAGQTQSRFTLWRNGEELALFDGPANSGLASIFGWVSSPEQSLLIYTHDDDQNPANQTPSTFHLFDLKSCSLAGCESKAISVSGFPVWSPDGRWLLSSLFDSARFMWSLQAHDIDRNETRTFTFNHPYTVYPYASPKYDWSADGQWLLTVNDGVLHLIAPAYDYQQTIVPESPGCTFAAWVNHK